MDLTKTLAGLYVEKGKVELAIAACEDLFSARGGSLPVIPKVERRGRKSMGGEERKQVSKRMKRYWAKRRAEREANDAALTN